MRTRQLTSLSAVAVAAALLVAACGDDDSSSGAATTAGGSSSATTAAKSDYAPIPDGPIKVGLSLSLSGALAQYGLQSQKAWTQATLDQFNKMHPDGIDGHQVELVIKDDAGDATTSANIANQFVSDKLAAVVKVSDIPTAASLQMEILNKAKMPVISYQQRDVYIDTQKWPYAFGVLTSTKQNGEATAEWFAKHPQYSKIAVLTDDLDASKELTNDILDPLETKAPNASVVKTVSIPPGATDVSTALLQLKQANPDLVLVAVNQGFGAIWTGFKALSWDPPLMTYGGAFYDSYDSMKELADNGFAPTSDCVRKDHPPFSPQLTTLMDAYVGAVGTISPNMLIYVNTDSMQLELLKYAIEKNHSTDPNAIKSALEGMDNQSFIDPLFVYDFSPDNHFGLTGDLGAQVCNLAPLVDGQYRIPTIAD
jgi:ABC-type branched-subunit amino acid transport system substrate-binding protein